MRGKSEVLLDGHAIWRGVVRKARLAQLKHQVAALGDFQRVGHGGRHVGEQFLHRNLRLEILFAREFAHAPLVAQDLAFGNADTRFVRLVVVFTRELNWVRGNDRQVQPCGQLHRSCNMRFVVDPAGALHFNVEAMRKHRSQCQRRVRRALLVALQQGLTDRPRLRTRQRDQPFAKFAQPLELARRLRLDHVTCPATRQQLAQVEVTLFVLHQQHHAREHAGVLAQALENDLASNDRLDACPACFFVKFDCAEQVVQVGNRQCGLPVARCGLHGFIDAVRAVDDGKFGVQSKVNKHPRILRCAQAP